jgi:hypothetical protein
MTLEQGKIQVGIVDVATTQGRGFTAEEVAERCLNKILMVSDSAPSAIKEQAFAYKDSLRSVLVFYIKEAIKSDRTTVCNALLDAGQKELAELIRRL